MSLESGIKKYFLARPEIRGVIGDSFFPQQAAEGSERYVVFKIVDTDEPRDINGNRISQKYTFELGCFAPHFDDLVELARLIKEAVGGKEGKSVKAIIDGTPVTMYWDDSAERYGKVSVPGGETQHLVYLDLIVLLRGYIGSVTNAGADVVIQG